MKFFSKISDLLFSSYVPVILSLFLALSLVTSMSSAAQKKQMNGSYELIKGLEYLKSVEKSSPDAANEFFRAKTESSQNEEAKSELLQSLNDDSIDVFSLFKEYVILGDSRALGFSHFGFLDYKRVFANGGDTISKSLEHIDKIKNLDPSYIYLCYGINDAGGSRWSTTDAYAADLLKIVQELQQAFPNAKIIVSSIIWISEGAQRNHPKWGRIYEFNPLCKQICLENGIAYADNDEICQILKADRLWSGDGVHLSKSFYHLWAKNLLLAAWEDGQS